MPFIHIHSLPQAGPFDSDEAVRAISREFAAATATDERHVTVTWEWLQPGHYCHAGHTAAVQPPASHPLLVELLAPDFNSDERIERMLEVVAGAVAAQVGTGEANVFVAFRPARSGHVFDCGQLIRW